MKGKVYRVTFNRVEQTATLYLEDGETKVVPMTEEKWNSIANGNLVENLNNLLDE